jgi:hypothetical protein
MPVFSSAKERRIVALLKKGYGIREIMIAENTSYTPIRRLIASTGVRPLKYHNTDAEKVLEESQFTCPGIGNCCTCKRLFQYPCKLGYDS